MFFIQHLLRGFFVPGTVLGTADEAVKKPRLGSHGTYLLVVIEIKR